MDSTPPGPQVLVARRTLRVRPLRGHQMRPNVALIFPFFAGVAGARVGTRGRKGILAPLWVSVGGVPRLGPPGSLCSRAGGAGAALGRAGIFSGFFRVSLTATPGQRAPMPTYVRTQPHVNELYVCVHDDHMRCVHAQVCAATLHTCAQFMLGQIRHDECHRRVASAV